MPQRTWRRLARRLLGIVATVGAVIWVLLLLREVWPQVAAHAAEIRVAPLVLGLALAVAAAWLTFVAFAQMLPHFGIEPMRAAELAHLYFTAQLLKHLPGRVWGIGYQWAAGASFASGRHWLLLNLAHMLLATYFAMAAAAVVLAFRFGWVPTVFAAAGTLALFFLTWTAVSSATVPRVLLRFLPERLRRLGAEIGAMLRAVPSLTRFAILACFVLSWFLYYGAWYASGCAYPPLGGAAAVQLCAYYMIAWFVGYVSFLTPSGLGVRELVFAWLAQSFPGDAIALMALIGRGNLMLVDLLLGICFAPFVPKPRAS